MKPVDWEAEKGEKKLQRMGNKSCLLIEQLNTMKQEVECFLFQVHSKRAAEQLPFVGLELPVNEARRVSNENGA